MGAPITTKLAQISGNDFALMDNNVTIGHLKNLVTDKPAPITTKLAQSKGPDAANAFALMDNNVTFGHLKNLVTDKPAPTVPQVSLVCPVMRKSMEMLGLADPTLFLT